MTSRLPPRLRDTRGPADLIRQLKQNGRQLNSGLLGGRWPPAKPLGAAAQEGDFEDDDPLDDDQPAAWNLDHATASVAGQVSLTLTYVPIDGTLLVFWDGIYLHPSEYVLADQTVTFTDRHVHVGHELEAAYWYWPTDLPLPPLPATVVLRGGTSNEGGNGVSALANIALPTGTVVGDLIAVACGPSTTVTDPRLTAISTSLYVGFATDLSDVQATAPGGFGQRWAIAVITLETNAVGWGTPVGTSDQTMVNGDTLAVGVVDGVSASLCALWDGHSGTSGGSGVPTGYSSGRGSGFALLHVRIDFWDNGGVLGTSPSGPTTLSGGDGGITSTVVGLIGPSDD